MTYNEKGRGTGSKYFCTSYKYRYIVDDNSVRTLQVNSGVIRAGR